MVTNHSDLIVLEFNLFTVLEQLIPAGGVFWKRVQGGVALLQEGSSSQNPVDAHAVPETVIERLCRALGLSALGTQQAVGLHLGSGSFPDRPRAWLGLAPPAVGTPYSTAPVTLEMAAENQACDLSLRGQSFRGKKVPTEQQLESLSQDHPSSETLANRARCLGGRLTRYITSVGGACAQAASLVRFL